MIDVKGYWRSVFITNWQTTSVGLTTVIATIVNYAWAWTHPAPGAVASMPDPQDYIAPFVAALFLIFRAIDPQNETKPPAP